MGKRWARSRPSNAGEWLALAVGLALVLAAVVVSLFGIVRVAQQLLGH